ncbi:MAG TPA: hypothetical protein VFO34_09350 [Candidatus Acidoferrales bacterium]|nr:hypothetical protein [Candidatus Acidoferrales bacterium]
MDDRITQSCMDRFDELALRISAARTQDEFREALDDMAVYLAAQQEIAAMSEAFPIDNAIHQHLA